MSSIRRFMNQLHPLFAKGGRLEKFYALYEMVDTFLYTPADVTYTAPHVRDAIDLKRVMTYVVIATLPVLLIGLYNTGYQANIAMAQLGLDSTPGWRGPLLDAIGYNASNPLACLLHGLVYFLPVYITTLAVGGFWEVVFAAVRNHEINEGFLVTSMLFALILPPDIPLWQVALGISFGVVVAKEIFGGTGKNFVNPALAGRAFLFFAYPGAISGDSVWVAVDGFSQATPLALGSVPGIDSAVGNIVAHGYSWWDCFMGIQPGNIGAESTLGCLLGAAFMLYTGVASWRIMAGVTLGLIGTVLIFNFSGGEAPMYGMPWYWHLVLGGFAFGTVFMATDPVSAAHTNAGRWVFGILIGFMTALIRVVNPAYPEGIMLAILFSNLFAPLIDYVVIRLNIRRRMMRNAKV
ncbi:MAG: NADH:ubiquinone reductase (Na(+)-transporting) subunit B [Gammaproteobacteria bacterium]|nr:NADH:ubiquinone reductase (Na(+)-transporting) subunit B [Gammaproteobacteria bacterium]